MPPSRAPKSLLMASQKMHDKLLNVRHAARELLERKLDFTPEEADNEEWNLLTPAFKHALHMAMVASPTVPVQPDWLIALTAHELWFMACVCCRYDTKYPKIPVHIPTPDMYNNSKEPSPEHQAWIEKRKAKKARASPRQTKAVARPTRADPQQAKRGVEEVAETTTTSFVLKWAPSLVSDSWLVQSLQSAFRAGKDDPSSGGEPVALCTEAGQELHPDVQGDHGCSTVGKSIDMSAILQRAETIARARRAITEFAGETADSDQILNYRFEVMDPDFEAMSLLWYLTGAADRWPATYCFPCSGKPWEVKVKRSSAALFFGPNFCHRNAILRRFHDFSGPAEIYAHFEGDFLYIGLTIPKDLVSTGLLEPTQVPLIVFSTIKTFGVLAGWARNVGLGDKHTFVQWIDFTLKQDSINDNMGAGKARG